MTEGIFQIISWLGFLNSTFPMSEGREENVSSQVSERKFFSKSFETVKNSDTLSKCLESFKNELPPVFAVLNSNVHGTHL